MEIDVVLTKESLVKFYKTYFPKTNFFTYCRIYMVISFLLVWYIEDIYNSSIPITLSDILNYVIILTLAWFVFFNIILLHLSTWSFKVSLSSNKCKNLFETKNIKLDGKSIICTSNSANTSIPLSTMKNLCVLEDFIFIILDSQSFLIPYTAFKDNSEREIFIKHITDNTNIKLQTHVPKDRRLYTEFI